MDNHDNKTINTKVTISDPDAFFLISCSTLKTSPYADSVEVCLITKDSEKVMEEKVKSISSVKKVREFVIAWNYRRNSRSNKICQKIRLSASAR